MVQIREWIEIAARGVEVLAVMIMVTFVIAGTMRWIFHSVKNAEKAYERYRVVLGKALLIGLELLVAADIIRTVILDTTLMNLSLLGILVVIRTFLGWTLTVEVDGKWPWQSKDRCAEGDKGNKDK